MRELIENILGLHESRQQKLEFNYIAYLESLILTNMIFIKNNNIRNNYVLQE